MRAALAPETAAAINSAAATTEWGLHSAGWGAIAGSKGCGKMSLSRE